MATGSLRWCIRNEKPRALHVTESRLSREVTITNPEKEGSMRKYCLILFVVLALILSITFPGPVGARVSGASAGTMVRGILPGDTTWTLTNSPYTLTADVQVPYGVALSIEAGTVVNGDGHHIGVWGALSAIGTEVQRITFNDAYLDIGYGFNPARPASIDIEHAFINGGCYYSGSDHGILILRDSFVSDSSGIYLWYPAADSYIERNVFLRSGGISVGISGPNLFQGMVSETNVFVRNNVFVAQTGYAVENWAAYGSQTFVQYNSFLSTDRIAVALPSGYSPAAMVADHNYWNTADVPLIESMIFDKKDDLACAGYIPYMPFLNAPDPNTPTATSGVVTATAGQGGTISPSGAIAVDFGSSKSFTIAPSTGYHVLDVLVDGSSVGAVTSYPFTNVQASHTIHASFSPDAYTLTITPPVNGTVTKSPDQASYLSGTVITLTATPATGYSFTGWSGDLTGTTNPATITMDADKTVTATFTLSTTVRGDIGGNGTVGMDDALLLAQSIVGIATLTTAQRLAADVNGDGSITMADTLLVAQIVVGIVH